MKKLLIIFASASILVACNNKSDNNYEGDNDNAMVENDTISGENNSDTTLEMSREKRNSASGKNYPDSLIRVEGQELSWDHSVTYVLKGTAVERKTSFDRIASDLENKIKRLTAQNLDKDVIEKLNESNEKIGEAREKMVKADKKSIKGNTDDAIEKVEKAREKLNEAREKYMEAIEKLVNN